MRSVGAGGGGGDEQLLGEVKVVVVGVTEKNYNQPMNCPDNDGAEINCSGRNTSLDEDAIGKCWRQGAGGG